MAVVPVWIPGNIANAVETTTYALSVGTTTLSTIIIVTRILLVSRMPGASISIRLAAEIITESAILYTVSALVYIGMIPHIPYSYYDIYAWVFFAYMAVRPLLFLYAPFKSSQQNFAPVFIMLRVAVGRARPETEWKISGLKFTSNLGGGAGAQISEDRSRSHGTGGGFGTNTIIAVPGGYLEPEIDIEARDGTSDEDSVHEKEN
jgi:hypothetical protein